MMVTEMYGEIRGALGREHVAKGNVIRIQYEIGGLLIDLKEATPHGDFGKVCDAEFGMTTATANSYMRLVTDFPSVDYVIENFNSKYAAIESLKVSRPKRVSEDGLGPDNTLPDAGDGGGGGESNLKGPLDLTDGDGDGAALQEAGQVESPGGDGEDAGPAEKSKALDPPKADVEENPPESDSDDDGHINQSGGEDDDPISPKSEKSPGGDFSDDVKRAARDQYEEKNRAPKAKPKADVKADVKALKKEVKELRHENKSQDNRIQLLEDQNRAVQRKYKALKRANDKALADRDAARKRAEVAEGRVADLEEQLAKLRAEKGKADAVADAEMMGMDPEKAAQVQAVIDMANEQAAA